MTYVERLPAKMFREAALKQRRCQSCGLMGFKKLDAHHVVYEQHLRREGLPRFTPANALLLCANCHQRHHNRKGVLPTAVLTNENLEFVVETFGAPRALEYLRRYYDTGPRDVRVLALEQQVGQSQPGEGDPDQ